MSVTKWSVNQWSQYPPKKTLIIIPFKIHILTSNTYRRLHPNVRPGLINNLLKPINNLLTYRRLHPNVRPGLRLPSILPLWNEELRLQRCLTDTWNRFKIWRNHSVSYGVRTSVEDAVKMFIYQRVCESRQPSAIEIMLKWIIQVLPFIIMLSFCYVNCTALH